HLSQLDLSGGRPVAVPRGVRLRPDPAALSARCRFSPDWTLRRRRSLRTEPPTRVGPRHLLEARLRHHPLTVATADLFAWRTSAGDLHGLACHRARPLRDPIRRL